jgi:hypothetical protein
LNVLSDCACATSPKKPMSDLGAYMTAECFVRNSVPATASVSPTMFLPGASRVRRQNPRE